jgi:N-acylglucosamine-6-phosphate 2-epimerase
MRLETLESGLIVSCQAPVGSPLHDPAIIATVARACVGRGAVGVRIDTPSHVRATREQLPGTPIIGLWKRYHGDCEVYITPKAADGLEIARAGADIVAIDATSRARPDGETLAEIIARLHRETGKPIVADVDSIENAVAAVEAGADMVGTTLYGHTRETAHLQPPGFSLLREMVDRISVPVICEGGIATPEQARFALEIGAYTVVVGTAITGIDNKTAAFVSGLAARGPLGS